MNHDLVFLTSTHNLQCKTVVDKHLEGYATIQYMERGGVEVSYDEREYVLEGSWFWPAHPGRLVRFHVAPTYDSWYHRHLGFRGSLVNEWMAAGLWPHEPQVAPSGKNWSVFFDEMVAQSKRSDALGRLRAINLLEQLLLELAEVRTAEVAREKWLIRVLETLEAQEAPDYESIARQAGMSIGTLRRRFKQATGTTLHFYWLQGRMAQARQLLAESDLPIKAIADQLGYQNVYFFARQFRQFCGVAPGLYRKSRQ